MDTQIDRTTRPAPRMTWAPVTDSRGRVHLQARWVAGPRPGTDADAG